MKGTIFSCYYPRTRATMLFALASANRVRWRPAAPPAVLLAKMPSLPAGPARCITERESAWVQDYGENTAQQTIGNSNYNALETSLRHIGKRSDFLLGYTYSKSIDQASNLGEQLNPLNARGDPRNFGF